MTYGGSRWLCLAGLVLECSMATVDHQASAVDLDGEDLGITVDFTYASKYLWHGIDVFDDHGAYQPAVFFNYRNFFGGVWNSWPTTSGFEDWKEVDLFFGFTETCFEKERYAVISKIDYWYVSHPSSDGSNDVQQVSCQLSMPNLFPIGSSSLIPSYAIFHAGKGLRGKNTIDDGWFQTFALSYEFLVPALVPAQEKQPLTVSWDLNFNDGVFGGDSGLSHTTLNLSTVFTSGRMYVSPAIHYQWSFLDTVNPEDEFYFTIGMGYRF